MSTYQHEETGRIVVMNAHPGRRWISIPDGSIEGHCEACGYRACDDAIHMDHTLCVNSGNEPWTPKETNQCDS